MLLPDQKNDSFSCILIILDGKVRGKPQRIGCKSITISKYKNARSLLLFKDVCSKKVGTQSWLCCVLALNYSQVNTKHECIIPWK